MTWLIQPRPDAIPSGPVEARELIAELLKCHHERETEKIKIWVGNTHVCVAELVQINFIDGPFDEFLFEGDFDQYHGIGWKLQSGNIVVNGNAGSRTGAEMSGGSIEIQGNCGSWAGVAMSGGRLFIHGSAGNWLGSNWLGETKGMTGGEILVGGDVADNAGAYMRRGTIAIAGAAGPGLASGMIAGSIFVSGHVSQYPGVGMKRGSIVLSNNQQLNTLLLPSFLPDGHFRPLTLGMQLHYLADTGWHEANKMLEKRECQRYFGDTLSLGLGEVIALTD